VIYLEYSPLAVKVWGDFACFTRPEMKVERVSYPVMTPSAARGVLEAIFWKPEFEWQVREIWVLKPIKHFSILRNEINNKQSQRSAVSWAGSGGGYYADEDRAQRHTLALRDVAYIVKADVVLRSHADADQAKYRDQLRRRVQRGQCLFRPSLGCREFAGNFCEPNGTEVPENITDDLGIMLGEMTYTRDGRGTPVFFNAHVENGRMIVPQHIYGGARQ
jgi:CRISPR-associated protein Cas5d